MMPKKNSCLLIWPPFITVSKLPLGIPFLTTYLRKSGIDNIKVIDLNMAYLQKIRSFWFLYMLNRRYWQLVNNASYILKKIRQRNKSQDVKEIKRRSPDIKKKEKPFWKKIIIYIHSHINRKINEPLDLIIDREKKSLPWSLESIAGSDLGNDYTAHRRKIYSILDSLIKKNNFSLIGLSVIYPEQLFFAFMVAKVIKEEIDKDIYIVLGGAQITKHINYLIKSEKIYDFVDFFVTDDGEEPLAKLLEGLPKKRFCDVPNLYFKDTNRAKGYEKSQRIFYLHPKDFLIPDFMGFDFDIYRDQIPILASKGCFWSKCNFCTYASMQEHRYCISTVEKTLGIIKEMKRIYRVSRYRFVDDALPSKFMERLAEGLFKDKLNIKWASNIILSREFASQDFCRTLRNSDLFQVSIGLESISSRILNLMNKYHKNISESEIKDILANLKNVGIRVGIHTIFGFPTETVDEARQTLNFLIENRDLYDVCMVQPFCLEDNTPVFNNPGQFGIVRIHKEDKNSGERLGYRYEVAEGMTQEEAKRFTYGEAIRALRKADVSVKSSTSEVYRSDM